MTNLDWRDRAACATEDPDLFFPVGTGEASVLQTQQAKAVCQRCPVTSTCLDWALTTGQNAGVWGGLSEDERRASPARKPRSRQLRPCGTRAAYQRHLYRGEQPCELCQAANRVDQSSRPRLVPCGTNSAYQRHIRKGEPIDEACRIAHNQADRRLRNTGTTKELTAS